MSLGSLPTVLRPSLETRTRSDTRHIQCRIDTEAIACPETRPRPSKAHTRVRRCPTHRDPVRRRFAAVSRRSGALSRPCSTLHLSSAFIERHSASFGRESASKCAHAPRPSRRSETSSTSETYRSKGKTQREPVGSIRNRMGKVSDEASLSREDRPLGSPVSNAKGTAEPFETERDPLSNRMTTETHRVEPRRSFAPEGRG
eukprot:scaffold416_cov329-Pavlova_lutheri.AAC.36